MWQSVTMLSFRQPSGRSLALLLGGIVVASIAVPASAQSRASEYEQPPINYSRRTPQDAVARLLKRVTAGEFQFAGSDTEILRAVLQALEVPVESQVVVFSKTSLQAGLIQPSNPRALYFSDSVYVGWVAGGLIEVAAMDPELGPIFYALDPQDTRDARRTFVRESSCLRCSFLIYSDSFAALPVPLKGLIFDRLQAALTDAVPQERYAYLEKDKRRRIFEVLNETLPEARQHFQQSIH